jgi:1-hydroxycarotenoid 3,4-desaturase
MQTDSKRPVVIIGAGIAGLAAAVALAGKGMAVTVLERASAPGGKMRQVLVDGRPIDAGPTVFTMRWVFDELLEGIGRSLDDVATLKPASILARHGWADGSRFDLFADRRQAVDAVGAFAGAAEARRFTAFLAHARDVYDHIGMSFMRAPDAGFARMARATGAKGALAMARINPMGTLWKSLGAYFRDPRLHQLFARYATYYGSSPFHCPPNLMLVAHVEQEGVWYVDCGMHALAQGMARLVGTLGGTIRYGAEVRRIERDTRGRAAAVMLANGERLDASAIIVNADAAAVTTGLFGDGVREATVPTPPKDRSLSALTVATVAQVEGFPLLRHTVLFSDAYKREFDAILNEGRISDDPTVYICAQDRADEGVAPEGGRERLLYLINAPARGDRGGFGPEEIERCRDAMTRVMARCGLKLQEAPDTVVTTPEGFESLFPATGGALYGRASHGWTAFFQRPGIRTRVPGLYLAGGSAHPGAGVPTSALSGRTAAACLMADRTSR